MLSFHFRLIAFKSHFQMLDQHLIHINVVKRMCSLNVV